MTRQSATATLSGGVLTLRGEKSTESERKDGETKTFAGILGEFGLSREQRAKVETEAQTIAIERFKAKAAELAKGFGFTGYSLREVSVNANDQGFPRPVRMAMEAKAASADSALQVEAGKSTVMVTVSGSVQLK